MDKAEIEKLIESRQNYYRIMDEAKKQVEEYTEQIKAIMGENESLIVGPFKVTWKEVTKTVADTAKMKSAGIYEAFSKQQVSRPFRVD